MTFTPHWTFLWYFVVNLMEVTHEDACSWETNLGLVWINENLPNGSVVYTYTIFENNSGIVSASVLFPNNDSFYMNVSNFQLIALTVFDSEVKNNYNLRLSINCISGEAQVFEQTININNLNDNMATWKLPDSLEYYTGYITDNSSVNAEVSFNSLPMFTDSDRPSLHEIDLNDDTFYTSSGDGQSTVRIFNRKLLDYDFQKIYNLTMILKDKDVDTGFVRFTSNVTVIIIINDTDSKKPIFEMTYYEFDIYNNASWGSVFQVSPKPIRAFDGDRAINTTILYKLEGQISYLFLDPFTGVLHSNVSILTEIQLQTKIIAYQRNNISQQTSVNVTIKILQSIPIVPVTFSLKNLSVHFEENRIGELIQLNVTSAKNRFIAFTMIPVVQNFKIEPTGKILVSQPLNYSLRNFYKFTISATDETTIDQMILLVNVIKVITFTPRFSQPSYNFIGNISKGLVFGIIKVLGVNPNGTLMFRLDKDFGIFKINSSNGLLYVPSSKSNSIQAKVYKLMITVTDTSRPQFSISVNVTIDFSENGKTSDASMVLSKEELLLINILTPIFVILILIFPILLCYFKNCPSHRTTRYIFNLKHKGFRSSFCGESLRSQEFNKRDYQIYNIEGKDNCAYRQDNQPEFNALNSNGEKNIRPIELDNMEIMKMSLYTTDSNSLGSNALTNKSLENEVTL